MSKDKDCSRCGGKGTSPEGVCLPCGGIGVEPPAADVNISLTLTSFNWRKVIHGLCEGGADLTAFYQAAYAAGVPLPDHIRKILEMDCGTQPS